jgi:hypothetical protein
MYLLSDGMVHSYNPGRFIVGQCLLERGIRYNHFLLVFLTLQKGYHQM